MLRGLALILCISVAGLCHAAGSGFGAEFEGDEQRPHYINPFKGIRKVAIVPFYALTDTIDPRRFDRAFASQIENHPNWEVIYPQIFAQLAKSQNKVVATPHDAISMARQLGADAVILGEVRDFDAYYPPRIVLKVALYRTSLRDASRDVMNLMRRGIAVDQPTFKRSKAIYSLSESYDTGREHVMKLIKRYAARFDQSNDPMRYDLFLRSQDRFFEAISFTVSQDIAYATQAAAAKEADEKADSQQMSQAEDYRAVHPRQQGSGNRRTRRSSSD